MTDDLVDRTDEDAERGIFIRSNILSSTLQTGQNEVAGNSGHSRANRAWWDSDAASYYAEHGAFLGDADLVWGPEGRREADLQVFGDPAQLAACDVLEIGGGAAQGARWISRYARSVVASDLSGGMLAQAAHLNARHRTPLPLVQCDGTALPFRDDSFDLVFTAYGVVPFVADSQAVMNEAARVLRPGGRFVFSTTHPVRWAFADEPGPEGLTAYHSYFDRTPYVEYAGPDEQGVQSGDVLYAEHHRTLGDRVRELGKAGLVLEDLIEPEWPADNTQVWGGWSPMRGVLLPGTAIFVSRRSSEPKA